MLSMRFFFKFFILQMSWIRINKGRLKDILTKNLVSPSGFFFFFFFLNFNVHVYKK